MLEERDRNYQRRLAELKQEIAIGIEAAESGDLVDGETVFRELREKNHLRSMSV
ncbi:MAG: hypothetical protein AB4352_15505 [Hormoscilla sp.]